MTRRIHHKARHFLQNSSGQGIKEHHSIDFVVKKFDAHGNFGVFRGEDVDRVASHAEGAAQEIHVVAFILHHDELMNEVFPSFRVPLTQNEAHQRVAFRFADTVNR